MAENPPSAGDTDPDPEAADPLQLTPQSVTQAVERRKAILLSVWGGIPEFHRPDLLVRHSQLITPNYPWQDGEEDSLKPPYINLEDMCKVEPLLLMLNSRATVGSIPKTRTNAQRWDKTGRDYSPGEGLWVLEVQAFRYEFLRMCCEDILHDAESLVISSYEALYKAPEKANFDRLEYLVRAVERLLDKDSQPTLSFGIPQDDLLWGAVIRNTVLKAI
ncbi:hypothetical protein GGS23DRAFT_593157 [Durotheca rogersii]|uniref:uncharacterized protein n=1 Tax=Durotheca rogersii TaxID=419775 RepID=UPI002220C424|nr:uncharacterized protein GGS23DRAFT_593157 [Durotheca rogersii]KAI5866404.1 hypothetical protein GGS23DRAFT_593157 [Durotheca rogersii]